MFIIYGVVYSTIQILNVNPKLNANIQFWDILELFDRYGFKQEEHKNFALMLEITNLIGCLNKKDELKVKRLLTVLNSKISESQK